MTKDNKKDKVILEAQELVETQSKFIESLLGDCAVLSEWIKLLRQGNTDKLFLASIDKYLASKEEADKDKNITLH